MKDILVFYHGDCPDGFGGAWAAWNKFGDSAEYIPAHHQQPLEEKITGKTIYFVDFVYQEPIMKRLIADNVKVTAIDHHFSAGPVVKLTSDYLYEMEHSGSVLAWRYFHPDKPVPSLLKYVEDTDLWKFNMPDSRDLFAYLTLQNQNFETWSEMAKDFEIPENFNKYKEQGQLLTRYGEYLMGRLAEESAELVEFEGHKTYAINAPHFFASRLGEILYHKMPPMAIIWSQIHGKITVSLRSDGSVDVSELAKRHGGGGHKSSSGFSFADVAERPWKKL